MAGKASGRRHGVCEQNQRQILGAAQLPRANSYARDASTHAAHQLPAYNKSPMSSPVKVLAPRASQYIKPIIINIEGTAMMG